MPSSPTCRCRSGTPTRSFIATGQLSSDKDEQHRSRQAVYAACPRPRCPDRCAARSTKARTDEERIKLVTEVLDEAGITAPPPRDPLPDIEKHEVRLVTWMAVRGTRGLEQADGDEVDMSDALPPSGDELV